jgi:hypothetical protein
MFRSALREVNLKSHSAEGAPRNAENHERGTESNEEGRKDGQARRKIPRMFQKHANKEQGEGSSEEETTQTPLETIDITLTGGVDVKLYLNRRNYRFVKRHSNVYSNFNNCTNWFNHYQYYFRWCCNI